MPAALVIPGLLAIDPRLWDGRGRAEVVRGPLAGLAALPDLLDWKREVWLLPREVAARHGAPAPEQRRDLSGQPRLRARFARAALVLVDEPAARRALAAGDSAVFLAYHRVAGGGGLEVHGRDGARGFSADDASLRRAVAGDEDDAGHLSTVDLYDRTLRALTGDALSLNDVDLADFAAHLSPAEYASHEAELAEIEALAAQQRPLADAVLAALDAADTDAAELPGDYLARRTREPAFTLRPAPGVDVRGGPIRVPARERWFVADVQDFTPAARKARRDRILAAQLARQARPLGCSPRLAAVVVALLVVLAVVAWLR